VKHFSKSPPVLVQLLQRPTARLSREPRQARRGRPPPTHLIVPFPRRWGQAASSPPGRVLWRWKERLSATSVIVENRVGRPLAVGAARGCAPPAPRPTDTTLRMRCRRCGGAAGG